MEQEQFKDEETEEMTSYTVCVTGGAGLIASSLIKKIIQRGHMVHATLRSLDDKSKVGLLRELPGAETRLVLFEADADRPHLYEAAIKGCDFVFHVATVFLRPNSKWDDAIEGVVGLARNVAKYCIESGTVKRLIYTGSVVSASPIKEDGSGFKDTMDESSYTPLKLSAYTDSKTLGGTEVLRFGCDQEDGKSTAMEVVSLDLGLTGGDTLLPYMSSSVLIMASLVTNDETQIKFLLFLEELLGKVPIVHMDDVCEAHIFCMEQKSMNGRFLCASSYVSSAEIAQYYSQAFPQLRVQLKYLDGPMRNIRWGSTKLIDKGFMYKHDTMGSILDDTVACATRLGYL
ncbi:NADPH HC-toxin reductase 1-like protein [Drosera capensis]